MCVCVLRLEKGCNHELVQETRPQGGLHHATGCCWNRIACEVVVLTNHLKIFGSLVIRMSTSETQFVWYSTCRLQMCKLAGSLRRNPWQSY